MATNLDHLDTGASYRTLAQGLGWFSLALGALEVLAPGTLDETLGTRHHEPVIRAFGFREIVAGLGILLSRDPARWVWARVAGDALDLASLSPAPRENNPQRTWAMSAFANVALITALDIVCAVGLSRRR